MPPITPAMARTGAVRWLLDLTWAGRTWRVSDETVTVTTAAGDELVYDGGIGKLEVEESSDDAGGTSAPVSVSMEVDLAGADVAGLVARGFDLSTATGELSRWVEGTTYEARRVMVVGAVADPAYGHRTEPVALTLEALPWDDAGVFPPADLAVVGANWSLDQIVSLPADEVGLPYPMVFGAPGVVSTSVAAAGWVTGSCGAWVDRRQEAFTIDSGGPVVTGDTAELALVIAGHHVDATSIMLSTDDYVTGHRFVVANTSDRAGHPIAVCLWYASRPAGTDEWDWDGVPRSAGQYTFSSGGIDSIGANALSHDPSFHPLADTEAKVYASWRYGGGAVPSGGAGDVIVWLLGFARLGGGAEIDRSAWAAAAPSLNRYKIAGAITDTTRPWEFIAAHILPILPVSIEVGPSGIYPIVWRSSATASDAVAHLDTGTDPRIERSGPIRVERRDLVNDVTVWYARSVRTGEYCGSVRLAGVLPASPDDTADTTPAEVHPFCRLSQMRYRDRAGRPLVVAHEIESAIIYDDATARLVAGDVIRARALAVRAVSYVCPEGDYGWIQRGHVVTITDEDVSLDGAVALVKSIAVTGDGWVTLGLALYEDPTRDMVTA